MIRHSCGRNKQCHQGQADKPRLHLVSRASTEGSCVAHSDIVAPIRARDKDKRVNLEVDLWEGLLEAEGRLKNMQLIQYVMN
jgi:hypothetical protein